MLFRFRHLNSRCWIGYKFVLGYRFRLRLWFRSRFGNDRNLFGHYGFVFDCGLFL